MDDQEPGMQPQPSRHPPPLDVHRIGADPDAFEAFYRAHVEDVQRFLARRVGSRERAADLTGEVFVAAIESAHTYRPHRGTPIAWLFGVARIVVAADRRTQGRADLAAGLVEGRRLLQDDDLARMDERLDAAAHSRRLFAAMERLPEGDRAVLELVALDELSVADAARALGLRPVTARVRLHRARRALRAALPPEAGEEPSTITATAEVAP